MDYDSERDGAEIAQASCSRRPGIGKTMFSFEVLSYYRQRMHNRHENGAYGAKKDRRHFTGCGSSETGKIFGF